MPKNLVVEYKRSVDLIPYVNNSRTHSEDQVTQIASSIKEFGFTNPILIDDAGGIIAGHGRLMAANKLGIEEVPTITLVGLTDNQRKAYVIADNKLALNSGWDTEMLNIEIGQLLEAGFDIGLLGFDEEELSELQVEVEELPDGDEEAVPEVKEDPITVAGDIWILDKHKLVCGDATLIDDMQKLMGEDLADMWLTDPPYNVNYQGGTKEKLKIENDNMEDEDFRTFLTDCYINADTVMKAGAVFYIWHADLESYNFRGAARDAGWAVRQCLIWNKSTLVMGRQDYHWKHEPCLYGWKEGAGHLWASDRKQTTVINFDKPQRNGEHPTMKPVELFSYCILNNTKGSDIVLDSFGGSGTTAISCEIHGRRARLLELDPRYCDVIVRRWQEFTGKVAIHFESGKSYNELAGESDG